MARTSSKTYLKSTLDMLDKEEREIKALLLRIKEARRLMSSTSRMAGDASQAISSISGASMSKGKAKTKVVAVRKPGRARGKKGLSIVESIKSALQTKGAPMKSADLIDAAFMTSGKKDRKRYAASIYPILTRAYKSGELVREDGYIRLP